MQGRLFSLKRYIQVLGGAFLWLLTLGFSWAGTCTINASQTNQYIHCIGASSAWSSVSGLGTQFFADDNVNGHIGLTSLRARIDPNNSFSSEVSQLVAAKNSNPNVLFWGTEWSPPAQYKANDNVDGGASNDTFLGASSGAANSDDTGLAAYQVSFIQYCKNQGINLYALSIQNEPNFNPTYEACLWSAGQFDVYVKAFYSAIQSAGLSTKIMLPEPDNPGGMNLASTAMADSAAAPEISIIASHMYGENLAPLSSYGFSNVTNQEWWETEISGNTTDVPGAMQEAGWIHSSLVDAGTNAFHYWWLQDLISGGSLDIKAFVLGNYSKFIRPGYYRMGATEVPSSGVSVSAFKNTNTSSPQTIVFVAINSNSSAVNQTFTISGVNVTSVTPWVTNGSTNLVAQSAVAVSGNSFTYSLTATSVTSFVGVVSGAANPTATFTFTPTKTNTPVPPTATFTFTPTKTNTPVPPTATFTNTFTHTNTPVPPTATNTFTFTSTNTAVPPTATSTPCSATAITPYYQLNGGSWTQANAVTVASLPATVNLGPQPLTGGSWSWTGPNGFTSATREIDGIPLSVGTNTFTATYTNGCGLNSTETFTVVVSTPATPTITNTPAPPTMTNTPAPPTVTNTPAPPTLTFTPAPPTATSSNTPVPPTATNTNSPVPPTVTNTPAPPTLTNTPAPPTATYTFTFTHTDTPVPPTATFTPTPSGAAALTVELLSAVTTDSTNSPHPFLQVVNTGSGPLNLNNVEVRYWFNCDCTNQTEQAWVDWAGLMPAGTSVTSDILVSVQPTSLGGQTNFVSYKFTGSLVLQAGQMLQIQSRFNKSDWSNMLQDNDWSFAAYTSYTPATKVTAYEGGTLVWGQEPTAATAAALKVASVIAYPNPSTGNGVNLAVNLSGTGTGSTTASAKDVTGSSSAAGIDPNAEITLKAYTLEGRLIWSTTVSGASFDSTGNHTVYWNERNVVGNYLANGLYIVTCTVKSQGQSSTSTAKLLILK